MQNLDDVISRIFLSMTRLDSNDRVMMFGRKLQHLGLLVVRRKRRVALLVILNMLAGLYLSWSTAKITSEALLPPLITKDLSHFRRSRSLKHYLDNIQLLIEPSSLPCESLETVPVVVLVTSAPHRAAHREAVRTTWAKHQPTYFFIGLSGNSVDESLVDNYMEAKLHGDLVVFDFRDHYQNLTLKTALMLQWTLDRCPQAEFMFKTDDDVLVNPWTLRTVLKENVDAKLLGYKLSTTAHRDETNKWYLPRWLLPEDLVPEYLSGTGYLINGEYLRPIFETAFRVPLINIEDIYFTYLIAKKRLNLKLTDDRRLSCHKPLLPASCAYWALASLHSLEPDEMVSVWPKIESLGQRKGAVCTSFINNLLSSEFFLY